METGTSPTRIVMCSSKIILAVGVVVEVEGAEEMMAVKGDGWWELWDELKFREPVNDS